MYVAKRSTTDKSNTCKQAEALSRVAHYEGVVDAMFDAVSVLLSQGLA